MSDDRNQDDAFELLSSLDPFAEVDGVDPDPMAREALFKEITMPNLTLAPTSSRPSAPTPSPAGHRWARFGAIGAGAFAVAAAAVVALLVVAPSATPAAALVMAAERTAQFESGRIEMLIDVRSVEADPELDGATQRIDYRFDGDDLGLRFTMTGAVGSADVELVHVDDTTYLSEEPGRFQEVGSNDGPNEGSPKEVIEVMWGLDTDQLDPTSLVELMADSENLERTTVDGVDSYRASVSAIDLVERLDELPAGVAFLASGEDRLAEMPESIDIVVDLADGHISSVRIEMVGDTRNAGEVDAGVTLTYSELGRSQAIDAPEIDG